MKVLVLGASGIIGQHMRLCVPAGVRAVFVGGPSSGGLDLSKAHNVFALLIAERPDVIVNLAGESNVDRLERAPAKHAPIMGTRSCWLGVHCARYRCHLVHVSTQAVFGGAQSPYSPMSATAPANEYGRQKERAELAVRHVDYWTIVRATFVLGVRPIQASGRVNPAEQILAGAQQRQVADRWFSPLFARDAAALLWKLAQDPPARQIVHLGVPKTVSRYDVARDLGADCMAALHTDFKGLAARPIDTTYAADALSLSSYEDGIQQIRKDWEARQNMDLEYRAREIALFLGKTEQECLVRLRQGFGVLHGAVREDFLSANPVTDEALLEWYRATESYIWELSAYHCDPGFNYTGMCHGIAERLAVAGVGSVLVLGDGIGDLTMALRRRGLRAFYHDLAASRTAEFARHRFHLAGEPFLAEMTSGWQPDIQGRYDAIVSLDFLEHVTDVPAWVEAIKGALVPGGLFCAQNAFGIGSGAQGSIPCHLARNDRFEKDWDPLLISLGFTRESSNWYRSEALVAAH